MQCVKLSGNVSQMHTPKALKTWLLDIFSYSSVLDLHPCL